MIYSITKQLLGDIPSQSQQSINNKQSWLLYSNLKSPWKFFGRVLVRSIQYATFSMIP